MCIFSKNKKRSRNLRKKGSSVDSMERLREFVYLDEVSLYSLFSSITGALPTQFTDSQTNSLERELEGNAGIKAGLAEANVRASSLVNRSQTLQVLRKATAQSTFKDFYERIQNSILVRLVMDSEKISEIDNIEDFKESDWKIDRGYLVINETSVTRGQIIEMAVELEAEPTFRVSAIASLVVNILKENSLFEYGIGKDLKNIEAVSQILENLINGLVPVQGRLIDYKVLCIEDQEFIVHNNVLKKLAVTGEKNKVLPLYFVGVAEQSLFWKDLRRVLFSKAQFRVLCRVAQPGLQKIWTPIKLVSVLEEINPQISKQINMLGSEALESLDTERLTGSQTHLLKHKALLEYGNLLAEYFQLENPINESFLKVDTLLDWENIENLREDFNKIVNIFMIKHQIKIDETSAAKFREIALEKVGLNMFGDKIDSRPNINEPQLNKDEKRYLDTELIAVYW